VIGIDTNSDDDKEGNKENSNAVTSASKTKLPTVRLAHFSVKEYLVSNRIRAGSAAFFSIDEKVSNVVIGETSLSCLLLYDKASFSDSKEFSEEFPLAKYSAHYWNDTSRKMARRIRPPFLWHQSFSCPKRKRETG
jgi:hypothetical protein